MNTSFDKETNTKNLTTKNRNILIKRTKNIEQINIIKSQDMLQNSKQVKKYYKKKNPKKKKNYESIAYNNLRNKYNFTADNYNILCINNLLNHKHCQSVSEFKEKMIVNYITEFLKREYTMKEIKKRIPKFYSYYKHYTIFFGLPFFKNFVFDKILQKNGENKARIYFKIRYQNGESKNEENEDLGFDQSESDYEEKKEDNCNLNNNNKRTTNIFDGTIKETIDNVSLMTTINSIENKTINLKLDNEKIEIFSENKADKSNDTTLGEIINYINNKDSNNKKSKQKDTNKKNISFPKYLQHLLNQDYKRIYINENNKKKLIDLINKDTNNPKKKIKTSSIKKKFIKNTNNNIINNNTLTQRNIIEPNLRINDEKKRKNIMSNKNINSNRVYNNKVNFLSLECEEKSHLIDSNSIKSPRLGNYGFNQINLNKYNKIRKSNLMNNNNYYTNKNKIKISRTFKNIYSSNKINNNKISKFSIKKNKNILDFINSTEIQNIKDKEKKIKETKTRNYINQINKLNNYNQNTNINFTKPTTNKKVYLSNLSYQSINNEKINFHQRIKSNNLENTLSSSKCLITDRNQIYKKPSIQINRKKKLKSEINEIVHDIKSSINENYNSFNNQKLSYNNINDMKKVNNLKYNKKININNNNKKTILSKYILDVIRNGFYKYPRKINKKNIKDKDAFYTSLSLMNNQNTNRKKNYNLYININNEININENNNINNNTYSINNYTERNGTKYKNIKNIVNLRQNNNNLNKNGMINSSRNHYQSLKKKISIDNNNIITYRKYGKKIRKRNFEKNINGALTTINNNITNSIVFNNSLECNKKIKRFISLYNNLNKSK